VFQAAVFAVAFGYEHPFVAFNQCGNVIMKILILAVFHWSLLQSNALFQTASNQSRLKKPTDVGKAV
jgi:hypothetical protein